MLSDREVRSNLCPKSLRVSQSLYAQSDGERKETEGTL